MAAQSGRGTSAERTFVTGRNGSETRLWTSILSASAAGGHDGSIPADFS
jgi:hypothetical protein